MERPRGRLVRIGVLTLLLAVAIPTAFQTNPHIAGVPAQVSVPHSPSHSGPLGVLARAANYSHLPSSEASLGVMLSVNPNLTDFGATVSITATPTGGSPPYRFYWLYEMVQFGCLATSARSLTIWTCPSVVTQSSSSSTISPDFQFTGRQNISVGVNDSKGGSAIATQEFVLNPPPRVNGIVAVPDPPRVGEKLAFSATFDGGTMPDNITWSFGDGGVANTLEPSHAYGSANEYAVVLTVRDAAGRTANGSLIVHLNPVTSHSSVRESSAIVAYAAIGVAIAAAVPAAIVMLWKRRRRSAPPPPPPSG